VVGWIFVVLVVINGEGVSQSLPLKLKIQLEEEKKYNGLPEVLHLGIEGDVTCLSKSVAGDRIRIKYAIGDLASIMIKNSDIHLIAENPCIKRIFWDGTQGIPLTDIMKSHNQIYQLYSPPLNSEDWSGKGVIIGFIDTGIDINHPDFKDGNGKTRILYLWDQRAPYDPVRTPQPYGYGQEWSKNDIDNGICPHQDTIAYGHGTNVAGAASSNGRAAGYFSGVAPNSYIIMVATNFGAMDWVMTVADGIHYIFNKAEQLGMPCVINLSVGTYSGARDSLELPTIIIDSLISQRNGRAVVCAAGNGGQFPPFHIAPVLNGDTQWVWFDMNPFLELWGDTQDIKNLEFAIGADDTLNMQFKGYSKFLSYTSMLGPSIYDTLISTDGETVAIINWWATIERSRAHIQLYIPQILKPQYRLRFAARGTGTFDMWSHPFITGTARLISGPLPDSSLFPDIKKYIHPDSNSNIVGFWNCSPKVISVGNYVNRQTYVDLNNNIQVLPYPAGILHPTSSRGPGRRGLLKPDVIAPGSWQVTAGSLPNLAVEKVLAPHQVSFTGYHKIKGGTSMASPTVAGISALIFQRCPDMDYRTLKNIIINNTYKDSAVANLPPIQIGYGKVSAANAVSSIYKHPSIITTSNEICPGTYTILNVNGQFKKYVWNNGDTTPSLLVSSPGIYYVRVKDTLGCWWSSDTITILPKQIQKYRITYYPDTIICYGDTAHLTIQPQPLYVMAWNTGETTTSIHVVKGGHYYALVMDTSGCSSPTDTIRIYVDTPRVDLILQNGVLYATGNFQTYWWFYNGNMISSGSQNTIPIIGAGSYTVVAENQHGCRDTSSTIIITSTNPIAYDIVPQHKETIFDMAGKTIRNPNNSSLYIIGHEKKPIIQK